MQNTESAPHPHPTPATANLPCGVRITNLPLAPPRNTHLLFGSVHSRPALQQPHDPTNAVEVADIEPVVLGTIVDTTPQELTPCPYCDKFLAVTQNMDEFLDHVATHHPDEYAKLPICTEDATHTQDSHVSDARLASEARKEYTHAHIRKTLADALLSMEVELTRPRSAPKRKRTRGWTIRISMSHSQAKYKIPSFYPDTFEAEAAEVRAVWQQRGWRIGYDLINNYPMLYITDERDKPDAKRARIATDTDTDACT